MCTLALRHISLHSPSSSLPSFCSNIANLVTVQQQEQQQQQQNSGKMPLSDTEPQEPPPPYSGHKSNTQNSTASVLPSTGSHLEVPHQIRSGIPAHDRRSMEDESRDLPSGWVRQYDSKSHHQFFVDARGNPPRSIWHHPYDDDLYLSSLPQSERDRIQHQNSNPEDDLSSTDEHGIPTHSEPASGKRIGQKIKDRLTNSTHAQRVAERRKRDEEEAQTYRRHQHIRKQMSLAAETGVPQLLGKDKDGRDVYIEPPGGPGGFGSTYGRGYGGPRSYGYNPYTQGPYSNPSAKFLRPQEPYGRPYPGYGYGYGGGFGMPLLGLGGGLLLGGLIC
jgi:hypothetical protein